MLGLLRTAFKPNLFVVALIGALAFTTSVSLAADPLPSWNDGPAKKAIVEFVDKGHHARFARLRSGAGTHRDLRQRRHAVE